MLCASSSLIVAAFLSLLGRGPVSGYNILGMFPYPGRSHYIVFDALMTELANRGHNVTVYTAFAKGGAVAKYREVDVGPCFALPDLLSVERMALLGASKWHFAGSVLFEFMPTAEQLANCVPLLQLWNRNASDGHAYDLMVTETFNTDFFLLFGHKLAVPVIAFHSSWPLPWMSRMVGMPDNPSYVPHPYSTYVASMGWPQRVQNAALYAYTWLAYKLRSERFYDRVAFDMFGAQAPSPPPPIGQLASRVSALFVYTHFSAIGAHPHVPAVVEVAGLNIRPADRPLPQDIERFINESKDGVVYFCMGSLLRGETFPAEKRNAFLTAFSKIPQRVLWKWEGDVLPGKSDDIMISKWMPQRDILAHPNVKLFISHGGLLGTSEAVYEGVPILGIPIFGDQRTNVKAIEANGAGLLLDYNDIGEEVVLEKIRAVLNDPKYKEKAKQLSDRYRDRPMSPLDTAVYWTEYVIRHKGAAHLRTAAVDMPWHQYLLLDVIAFLLVAAVSLLVVAYYACKVVARLVSTSLRRLRPRRRAQKEKRA